MQEKGRIAAIDQNVVSSDETSSPKRRWVTPAVRKLKVDRTEALPGLGDDGIIAQS